MAYEIFRELLNEAARKLGPEEIAQRKTFIKKMKAVAKKAALPELKKAKAGKIEVDDDGDNLNFEFDVRQKFGEFPKEFPDKESLALEEERRFPFAKKAQEKAVQAFQKEFKNTKPKRVQGVFGSANDIKQFSGTGSPADLQVVLNGKDGVKTGMHDVGLTIRFKPAGRKIF
jgi:hypothetical protein